MTIKEKLKLMDELKKLNDKRVQEFIQGAEKAQPDKGVMQPSSTTPSSPSCSRPCPMGTN